MEKWLGAALDYIPRWLEFQVRATEQPGCVIAIAQKGRIVLDKAYGFADALKGMPLTPRHRFRVASHSKSFAAAGVMKLREGRRLRLDDEAGQYVEGLHLDVARVTIGQLLAHSAGIVRDGADTGQWADRRPFLNAEELRAELAQPPVLAANTRFKYSNHGFGLVGLVMEAVTGESYVSWIKREIVDAVGLDETLPDMPRRLGAPMARGHSGRVLLGRRVIIPGLNRTHALAPATGFVSTAHDLALFFSQLSPKATRSILSVASRREMVRRQWREPNVSIERHYGQGIISGTLGGWDWFGHSGGFQGFITRTSVFPDQDLAVSVLTNASDGLAHFWLDGAVQILRAFRDNGPPSRRVRGWGGRWWGSWGPLDFVPMGNKVIMAGPIFFNPFLDASEIAVTSRTKGRIALAPGLANHGEPVILKRNARGRVTEVVAAGTRLLQEKRVRQEMQERYDPPKKKRRTRG